MDLYLF